MTSRRHSFDVISAALVAAERQAGTGHSAVSLWVVWLRGDAVLFGESATRLDLGIPDIPPVGADSAVIVAVAPTRVAQPVVGRAVVIADYLQARGLAVHTVHASALQPGALWTALGGNATGGVIPSVRQRGHVRHHRWLPGLGSSVGRPVLMASVASLAGMLFALPAAHAGPDGQAGVIAEPVPGQIGVTAPEAPTPPRVEPVGPLADPPTPIVVDTVTPEPVADQPVWSPPQPTIEPTPQYVPQPAPVEVVFEPNWMEPAYEAQEPVYTTPVVTQSEPTWVPELVVEPMWAPEPVVEPTYVDDPAPLVTEVAEPIPAESEWAMAEAVDYEPTWEDIEATTTAVFDDPAVAEMTGYDVDSGPYVEAFAPVIAPMLPEVGAVLESVAVAAEEIAEAAVVEAGAVVNSVLADLATSGH